MSHAITHGCHHPDPLPVSFVRLADVLKEVIVESFEHHFVVRLI